MSFVLELWNGGSAFGRFSDPHAAHDRHKVLVQ